MVVIEGGPCVQGNQGITQVGQRLVQILDGPFQAIIRSYQRGQLKSEEGDGFATRAQQQPPQQRGEYQEAIEGQIGEVAELEHQR
ncbi:hypothetical protein D3C80_1847540 [compost metagenome]